MTTIIIFALFALAALLFAMWMSPTLKDTIATSWGAVGAALVALLAWILAWFSGSPPELPM